MKKSIDSDDALFDFKNLPRVSLIVPFRQEMTKPPGLLKLLALATDKAEQKLLVKYSIEEIMPVMKKLRQLIKKVKCRKNEKTLAIFVSPITQKVYYFTPSHQAEIHLPVLVQNNLEEKEQSKESYIF